MSAHSASMCTWNIARSSPGLLYMTCSCSCWSVALGLLTVNRNGTVWLFIRADVYLLKLGEMLVGSLVCAIAVDGHHIQDHAVVDHPVDGRHGGHRIFENALPFTED